MRKQSPWSRGCRGGHARWEKGPRGLEPRPLARRSLPAAHSATPQTAKRRKARPRSGCSQILRPTAKRKIAVHGRTPMGPRLCCSPWTSRLARQGVQAPGTGEHAEGGRRADRRAADEGHARMPAKPMSTRASPTTASRRGGAVQHDAPGQGGVAPEGGRAAGSAPTAAARREGHADPHPATKTNSARCVGVAHPGLWWRRVSGMQELAEVFPPGSCETA